MHQHLRTRREFLGSAVFGAALAGTIPSFLSRTWGALDAAAKASATAPVTGRDGRILVVLQLAGGNDGLNTLVPYRDDHYRRARRRLGLPEGDLLRIDDTLAWHPALRGFRALTDRGHLSVIQGVGYPNPNRSHFRSMEIWHTASEADRVLREGWLGRFFDHACSGSDPTVGVHVGRQMPQAFWAKSPKGIGIAGSSRGRPGRDPRPGERFESAAMSSTTEDGPGSSIDTLDGTRDTPGSVLDFLDRTALDARLGDGKVREILGRHTASPAYPESGLGQSLKTVARLIEGGLPTRVYYLSQGGYDTHRDQLGQHARLLGELGDAVESFATDLKAQGNLDRVLVMTFSEFGRRVSENASGGTDHGAAGPMFLMSGSMPTPRLGTYPSLASADLRDGDLRHHVDFRAVYAGILEHWLGIPSEPILGAKFEPVRWS